MEVVESRSAFRRFARQFTLTVGTVTDPRGFFRIVRTEALRLPRENKGTRTKIVLRCMMERTTMITEEVISEEAAFSSGIKENLLGNEEREIWMNMIEESIDQMANFQRMGSNWRFESVGQLELHFVDFDPLQAGTWIKLPGKIALKKAVINPKTETTSASSGRFRSL